ncbi:MAG: hypothetical protein H6983_23665 [Ectothiorhodospiraceae bacterium]|nr:hypothetical protein [Ectothiorhodospiraceae bacterium]
MRTALRVVLATLGVAVVLVLVIAGSVRLLLPRVDDYRADITRRVSEMLGQPVSIGRLSAAWDGWRPVVEVHDVRLHDSDGNGEVARFTSARMTVDPVRSWEARELRPGLVEIRGAALTLARAPSGRLTVRALGTTVGAAGKERADSADPPLGDHAEALSGWLLRQSHLRLVDSRLVWLGASDSDRPGVLDGLEMDLRNRPGEHALKAAARVGDGGSVEVVVDVIGDPMAAGWSADVRLRARAAPLGAAPGLPALLGLAPRGTLEGDVASRWVGGALESAQGRVALRDVEATHAAALGPLALDASVDVRRGTERLRADLRDVVVGMGGTRTRVEHVRIEADPTLEDGSVVDLTFGHLAIADVLAVARGLRPGSLPAGLDARGTVTGLALRATLRAGAALTTAEARIEAESVTLGPRAPRLRDLRARVAVGAEGYRVALESGSIEGDAGGLIEPALALAIKGGRLVARDLGDGFHLEAREVMVADDVVAMTLRGDAVWRDGAFPHYGVAARIDDTAAPPLLRYLPSALLPKVLVEWLERAIVAGRIDRAEVELRRGAGTSPDGQEPLGPRIAARLDVHDATLDYGVGWPEISQASGHITFDDRRMSAVITDGQVSGARIARAEIGIADVGAPEPVLTVRGRVDGTTEQGAQFVRRSPLAPRFDHFLRAVRARGASSLDLDLELPLKGSPGRVEGVLTARANAVGLPGLDEGLEAVSGSFRFDALGVEASEVSARYLGEPIRLTAQPSRDGALTRVTVSGRATGPYLASHLYNSGLLRSPRVDDSPFLEHIEGTTGWQATIEVPNRRTRGERLALVEVESELRGVRVALPAPLGKSFTDPTALRVRTEFTADGDRIIDVRYGERVSAILRVVPDADGHPQLERGQIGFGPRPPALPEQAALLVSGRISRLPLGEWFRVAGAAAPAAAGGSPAGAMLDRVTGLDVRVDALELFGARLAETRISARRDRGDGWSLAVVGPATEGRIEVGAATAGTPIQVDFPRLTMTLTPSAGREPTRAEAALDPRRIPALRLRCGDCRIDGRTLGDLRLSTDPTPEGLRLTELAIDGAGVSARGTGAWGAGRGGQRSRLAMAVDGESLQALLAAVGHAGSGAEGGAARIDLEAEWPGAPLDFGLDAIAGTLRFRATAGRLPDVRRGATSRLFSLLMLPMLPRRLLFDFSDLFEDGFPYERMEGTFALEGGNAYTQRPADRGLRPPASMPRPHRRWPRTTSRR